jgi:hypothetical protein
VTHEEDGPTRYVRVRVPPKGSTVDPGQCVTCLLSIQGQQVTPNRANPNTDSELWVWEAYRVTVQRSRSVLHVVHPHQA